VDCQASKCHSQNTRLASKLTYMLLKERKKFGIFNIRYQGAKIWNFLHESYKDLSISQIKYKLRFDFLGKC
jgi:hypothetical protein